jgi:two-component system sensor histidine kinase YesM
MMAELNDDAETSRMTFMLARLLRYSISTKKQKVTVKQEIEHLRNYLELQNMRYEDKFELTVDLDDDLYNVGIIKLIFQPVVENAIVHGLEGIQGKGIIRVSGYHTDDRIIFTIEDNGKGIPADRLEELNRKINDFGPGEGGNGGIGLKNVNERIQLHYGDSYGLKLWSEPKKGTAVILEFPDMESMNKVAYEAGQSAIESK